ncbi:MAG: protein DpdD [Devosia sp.]
MIGVDLEAAQTLVSDLSAVGNFTALGSDVAALCAKVVESVSDPNFPGALIPSVGPGGDLRVLIAAQTMTAWRRLSPVLRAFAGPTLTSFDGLVEPFPVGDAVAEIVMRSQPAATGVMRLPPVQGNRASALRALVRARDTLSRAPNLQRSAPEPTSWLLARFQDYLNIGRRDAAADILVRLKGELRLDSLNLKFLEVQLLAAFGDWKGIVVLPGFASLCVARRTPLITALLLEALYQVHLANPFDAGDADETRLVFENAVRALAQPLLTVPVSPALTAAGWRIYGLEAWVTPSRGDINAAVADRSDVIGWVADRLPNVQPVQAAENLKAATPLDDARDALVRVDAVESTDTLAAVLSALAKLNPEEIAQLREAEPFRTSLQVAEEQTGRGVPTSWVEWLARAADPTFTSALDVARRGKDEWSIEAAARDPLLVDTLVSSLNQALGTDLAAERTAQSLPFLVAWLRRDPDFPRTAMMPIYASLLTVFALGSARGRATYESSQLLVNALLVGGLGIDAYRAVIADVEELAGDGFGIDMVYWMLEIIEDFMRASAPDAAAREAFLHGSLARISPIYARLSGLQRAAIARLATELGWTLQSIGVDAQTARIDDFAGRLRGLRIAIYSLTESSSRRAKAAIEEIAPQAVIDCSADHGGTARLRALAENADLFVLTSLSAKHAATDFIRQHRADRPLLYAQGRGFSSILRAIEDFMNSAGRST